MNQLDLDYQNLLKSILDTGVTKQDRTGTGTISIFGRQIRHKMSEGFPLLTTKKMAWKQIMTELMWFLKGDTNIKFLVDNECHIWDGDAYKNFVTEIGKKHSNHYEPISKKDFINRIKTDDEFAEQWGELGPIYGAQWRKWDGIDQIQELINTLKTNPDSRRMLVSAWNLNSLEDMVLPPCHYSFQVYTRELTANERKNLANEYSRLNQQFPLLYKVFPFTVNQETGKMNKESQNLYDIDVHQTIDNTNWNIPKRAISLMWNQRSVDTPLGLPFNIASYGLLLELLAKSLNMVADELIGNLGDCHIYLNQLDGVKEQLDKTSFDLPKLNINTEWWPTESGECGIGPLDADAIFNSFFDESFCRCLIHEDLQLYNYKSHSSIKFPLSN